MADKKQLIIGADVKNVETGLNRVKKLIDGLTKDGIKLSAAIKGMGIERNHGLAGFSKALVESSKHVKTFRGITDDTAKALKGNWSRTMAAEQQSLDRTSKQLERLNKLRKEQHSILTTSSGAAASRANVNVARIDQMIAGKVAERMSRQDALQELQPGGGGGRPWNSVRDGFRTMVAGTQAIMQGGAGILDTYQSGKTLPSSNIAMQHGFEKNQLGRMRGGDFSDLYFMMHHGKIARDGKTNLDFAIEQAGGQKAANLGNGLNAGANAAGILGSGLQLASPISAIAGDLGGMGGRTQDNANWPGAVGGITNKANGIYKSVQYAQNNGAAVTEGAAIQEQLAAQRASSPFSEAALDFIQSSAGARAQGAKALQGRHMGAWGTGSSYGLGIEESIGAAQQLSRGAGVNATMGRGGLLGQTLNLESRGMDRGVAGSAATQMLFANGGDSTRATKQLEFVMSKAFSVGLKDARLGEEIVKATADSSIGQGGKLTMPERVGAMLTGGLNSKSTLFDVQQNVSGLASINDRMNSNPYFNAVKLNASKHILDASGGGSHLQMLAMQRATIQELTGGSEQLTGAGVSAEQRNKLAHSMANAGVSSYLDRNEKKTANLQAALDSNGGDLIDAFRAAKKIKKGPGSFENVNKEYATLMSLHSDKSYQQLLGEGRDWSSYGEKSGKGGTYKRHRDADAEGTLEAQQAVLHKIYKQEIDMRTEYLKTLKAAPDFVDAIKSNDDFQGGDAFQRVLKEFVKVIEKALKQSSMNHATQGATRAQ